MHEQPISNAVAPKEVDLTLRSDTDAGADADADPDADPYADVDDDADDAVSNADTSDGIEAASATAPANSASASATARPPPDLGPPPTPHARTHTQSNEAEKAEVPDSSDELGPLADGASCQVKGSAATPYTIKRVGAVYSCTCPAWRHAGAALSAVRIRTLYMRHASRAAAAERRTHHAPRTCAHVRAHALRALITRTNFPQVTRAQHSHQTRAAFSCQVILEVLMKTLCASSEWF
eukprot:874920-Pleurochrysis_carterae.AAC.1